MNLFKRIGALAMATTMTLCCLTSCGGGASSSPAASSPAASTPAVSVPESIDLSSVTDPYQTIAGIPGSTVVATAGDQEITAGELVYWTAAGADGLLPYYQYYGMSELPWTSTNSEGVTLAQTLKKDALRTAALYAIIPMVAQKEGLALSAEFKDLLASAVTQMTTAFGGEDIMNYYLWQYPFTLDLYNQMCESEEYNAMLMDAHFTEGAPDYPDDAEVLQYVNDELQLYSVKHILLMTVDATTREPLDDKTIAKKKATAEDLVKQLQASDDKAALFDKLMHEYSEDTGLAAYPDGYLATEKGQMVAEFEEASLALEVGGVSGIVESDYGYHIIMRLPLEVNAADYREECINQKMVTLQDQWLAEYEFKTNDAYEQIDAQSMYATLGVLRTAVDGKMAEIAAELEAAAGSASGSASSAASSAASSQG